MNKEKIVNIVLAILGLALIGCIGFVAVYFFSGTTPAQDTLSASERTAVKLSERTQKYADCRYSSNSMVTVGIGFSFIEANNITDINRRSNVLDANDQLDKYIEERCSSFMEQYEKDFEQLKQSNVEIYRSTLSRWERLSNSDPEFPIPVEQAKVDPACFETIPALYCGSDVIKEKHILSDDEIEGFYFTRL